MRSFCLRIVFRPMLSLASGGIMTKFLLSLFVFSLLFSSACSQKNSSDTGPADEEDDSVANVLVTSLGDAQSQATSMTVSATSIQTIENDDVHSQATCLYSAARACDNAGTATVNWNGCTAGTATLTGTILETYAGNTTDSNSCHLRGTGTVLRKITQDRVLTFPSGATLTTDSGPDTAWDGTTFPSATTGTVIQRVIGGGPASLSCGAGTNACHHVTINGEQTVLVGRLGTTFFNHVVTGDFYYKGTRMNSNLIIDGTSTVWHQIARYKSVNTMTAVTWGDPGCCYPTSGTISGVVTGSVNGNVSLAFTSTCGSATYTDAGGATSTITLTQCLPQ